MAVLAARRPDRFACRAVRDAAERTGTVVFTLVPAEWNGRAHALVAEALDPRP